MNYEELTEEEKVALDKATADAEAVYAENNYSWTEMDDAYFEMLRKQYNKGPDEIGPRGFKSYIHDNNEPLYMLVFPAGKQHDGEVSTQFYHTIAEDLAYGECNGAYELLSETELFNKYNIKY